MRRTFLVNCDGSHLAALDHGRDVQVADGRQKRRSTVGDLLPQPLHHLLGQVVNVVLRHAVHDGLQQLATRAVVDVLRHRHQLRASGPQLDVQQYGVISVASEAVDLVDDQIGRLVLSDEQQHFLQLVTVGRLGRLTLFCELAQDRDAHALSPGLTVRALLRDRETFLQPAAFGLIFCRDAKVDHGGGLGTLGILGLLLGPQVSLV
ncbi:MAG: hypothetical protein FWF02_07875 [Micrococcales bacterium]|nr:hypothetical protein [Micrococcales bacterium]MCL2667608.1 hypothetical protein [Micrococcales bacterium]